MKKIYTKLFGELDMFAANPTLRSRKQPYSASPCLGAFSLVILGFFLWLFIKNVKQIANLESSQIKSSKNYEKQFENQTIDNLMFGVSFAVSLFDQTILNKRDISHFSNFFTFEVLVNNQRYALQPCTKDQWSLLGDNYQALFESYKLDRAYCLPSPVSIQSSTAESFLQIFFSKCKPSINPNCVDRAIIDSQIEVVIQELQHFPVWFSFLSPVVQIKQKYPLNYEIRYKRTAISPRYDKVATGYIIFQKYKVKSDYNVWPVGEQIEELAGFAPNTDYFSFEQAFRDVDNDTLIHLYCFRNENIEVHERSLTKIDEVLSYVGGLFGLIILAFQLCLGRYNEYKYQLKVGESSFNYDNDGFKIKSKDLNALTYIKYSIYTWFRLVGIKLNWKYYQQMDETRFQAKYCLDVSKFFRRLEFLQRVIWKQVDPDVLRTQSLIEANSIDEIKKKRHFYEYYQEVIKLEQAASVEDVLEGNKQAFTYLNFIFKSTMKNIQQKKSEKKNSQKQADADGKGWDEKIAEPKQSAQQIMDSLMYDLALEQLESVCKAISDSLESQTISEEAKKVKLKDHYLEVENILAKNFIKLKTQQKKKVIMKIPLKILHRLRLSAKQMNKQNSQQKQQGQKPKEEDVGKRGETAKNENKNEVNQLFKGLGPFSNKNQ